MVRESRWVWLLVTVGVVLVGTGLWTLYRVLNPAFMILETQGEVYRVSGGEDAFVEVGDVLASGERLRTSEGARAVVGAGSSVSFEVDGNTLVGFEREPWSSDVGLALESGVVRATVREGGPLLRMKSGTQQVVTQAPATIRMSRKGDATGVLIEEGEARIDGPSGQTTGEPGQEVLMFDDGLVWPSNQPVADLLKVRWPEKATATEPVWIRGQTSPRATVRLKGYPMAEVQADEDGRFAVQVPLRQGANELHLEVTHAVGGTLSESIVLHTETGDILREVELQYEP